MKNLLLTLLLISPASFADWGDVYYCQMTSKSKVTLEGKRSDYVLEKFQFKLNETLKAMVFGKGVYFNNSVLDLVDGNHSPMRAGNVAREYWWVQNEWGMGYFYNGRFLHSHVGSDGISSISADCDKF